MTKRFSTLKKGNVDKVLSVLSKSPPKTGTQKVEIINYEGFTIVKVADKPAVKRVP